MNGPRPSTRVFLSDLPSLPADSKVRFLGCVKTYHVPTGHLILEHNYPRPKRSRQPPQKNQEEREAIIPSVAVDINAVLETLTWEELRVGAWVNILGYVRAGSGSGSGSVYVDAVVVFPAGPIALDEYERILFDALQVERRVRRSG